MDIHAHIAWSEGELFGGVIGAAQTVGGELTEAADVGATHRVEPADNAAGRRGDGGGHGDSSYPGPAEYPSSVSCHAAIDDQFASSHPRRFIGREIQAPHRDIDRLAE